MTALAPPRPHHLDLLHPAFAALAGAAAFGVSLTAGEQLGLNAENGAGTTSTSDVLVYVGLVLAAVAVSVLLGTRARAGSPQRLARFAIGFAVASAVTFVAFWSGWPRVFAAVAIVLALEHRRRIDGFTPATLTSALVGALALTASVITCLFG